MWVHTCSMTGNQQLMTGTWRMGRPPATEIQSLEVYSYVKEYGYPLC